LTLDDLGGSLSIIVVGVCCTGWWRLPISVVRYLELEPR